MPYTSLVLLALVLTINNYILALNAPDVQLRIDIRVLATAPAYARHRDLFFLALSAMQSRSARDLNSYMQLAAIHGDPTYTYRGVRGLSNGRHTGGYCHHYDTLFAIWHRPYMVLFEQALLANARNISLQYPNSTRDLYIEAARTLRLPYWDWADAQTAISGIPDLFTSSTITINHPTRGSYALRNPLAYFLYPADSDAVFGAGTLLSMFQGFTRTVRYPFVTGTLAGTSNNAMVNSSIRAQTRNRAWSQQLLLALLQRDWRCMTFHNMTRCSIPSSLEAVHDNLHNTFGGSTGDMSRTRRAAFEPIFWLHHATVDRQLAIWQTLNPTAEYVKQGPCEGTFAIPEGYPLNASTPLFPFLVPGSTTRMLTSNDVRDWEKFGYTYPELQDRPSPSIMWSRVLALYGPSTPGFQWMAVMASRPLTDSPEPFNIDVFLNFPGLPSTATPLSVPYYCGTLHVQALEHNNMSRALQRGTVDCSYAMAQLGVTNPPPLNASRPSQGPRTFPFTAANITWVARTAASGRDYSSSLEVGADVAWLYTAADGTAATNLNFNNTEAVLPRRHRRRRRLTVGRMSHTKRS